MLNKLLILLTLFSTVFTSYLGYDGWLNIELHHALDIGHLDKFSLRGNVSISSFNSGSIKAIQEPLTADERNKLQKLAESGKFYRLKAIIKSSDGTQSTFLTSSKACSLVKSFLTDTLWISLDHVGTVVGISQTVAGSGNCQFLSKYDIDSLEDFNTDVYLKHMELAPIPDTASFVQKIEREREARERGEVKDVRGFFAKYWMYIVPVVLLVVISGAANPDVSAGR